MPQVQRYPHAIATLALCHAAQYYSVVAVYSYIGYYAVHQGWAHTVNDAGFVAGMLGGAMPFARAFTAVCWGCAADRWGRRPIVVFAMCSLAVGHAIFAFARPLWLAVAARFLFMGALNGWPSLTGLLAQELARERVRHALGIIYAAAGLVCVVAPALGSALYAKGPDELVRHFPAAVPSLVPAALASLAALAVLLFLPETRPSKPLSEFDEQAAVSASTNTHTEPATARSWRAVVRERPLPMLISLRTAMGFVEFGLQDVTPLFLVAQARYGGLELQVQQLGGIMVASATGTALYTSCLMGPVSARLSSSTEIVLGALLMAAATLAMPLVRGAANGALPWPLPVLVVIPMLAQGLAFMHVFTGLVAAFNAAVARHEETRGALNGFASTCMAGAMAIGPAAASPAFAAAIHAYPPLPSHHSAASVLEHMLLTGVELIHCAFALVMVGVALVAHVWSAEIRSLAPQAPSAQRVAVGAAERPDERPHEIERARAEQSASPSGLPSQGT